MENANQKSNKLKLEIYVPLEACACMYESFMNQVFSVLTEFMNYIDFETKSLNSLKARELKINQNAVVVEGDKVIYSAFKLKNELPSMLKEKGIMA